MKLPALAVTAFTVAAFVAGTAIAQMAPPVTMQPIPNPPENAKSTAHGKTAHKGKSHHAKAAPKAKAAPAAAEAPAPATPQ